MPPALKTTLLFALALVLAAATNGAAAQDSGSDSRQESAAPKQRPATDFGEAEGSQLRYSMALVDGGVVLLDRRTGDLEYCSVHAGQFVCRLATTEREGYEAEIARLRSRLDGLEAGRPDDEKPQPEPKSGPQAENDRRLDEAMRHAGRALRRFLDAVKDLHLDREGG